MTFIRVRRGLNIPIELRQSDQKPQRLPTRERVGVDFSPYASLRLKVLVKPGDEISVGSPLVEERIEEGMDKKSGRRPLRIVSTVSGKVESILRGAKRQPTGLIAKKTTAKTSSCTPLDFGEVNAKNAVIERMELFGLFSSIRKRPFDVPARPDELPEAIFIKGFDTSAGSPGYAELIEKHTSTFKLGLQALDLIAPGNVHLVCAESHQNTALHECAPARLHTVEGPYPACSPSLHIARIFPIQNPSNVRWTLDARTVVAIGAAVGDGSLFTEQQVALYNEGEWHLFDGVCGALAGDLLAAAGISLEGKKIIAGNLLTGEQISANSPIPTEALTLFAIPQNHERPALHFMRLRAQGFTATRTFFPSKQKNLSTNQHGEERPFVDGSIYDTISPLDIPIMPLVKAVIAEDFSLAKELGLLEVAAEDFALPTYICPSKIEMCEIIAAGLRRCAELELRTRGRVT